MAFTPERLRPALAHCLEPVGAGAQGLCLAFSGGLDSTVLLHALAALRTAPAMPTRAVHVDHGLQRDSADWARSCVATARRLDIDCSVVEVAVDAGAGRSPEEAARTARYAALGALLRRDEVLLTAHHADDQLETVLLQMLRGGGARAAGGMAPLARFSGGWHARPLLGFRREELRTWATGAGIRWHEDPSNLDLRFDRNYLRHAVLPALEARWPAAATTVGRVARLAREAVALAETLAASDLQALRRGSCLALAGLLELDGPRRRAVLRAWLRERALPLPTEAQLLALEHDVSSAADDRVPCIDWPGCRVYRYRAHLHAMAALPPVATTGLDWAREAALPWPGGGRLTLEPAVGEGLSSARLPGELRVTTRRGGEHFVPAGLSTRRPLRKWLQEHGVLPWQRDALPLVWSGEQLLAVGDLAHGAAFAARPGEPALRIVWHERPVVTQGDAIGYTALPS